MDSPILCNPNAFDAAQRQTWETLFRRLRESIVERRELADGYAFRLDPQGLTRRELNEWIALESRCCPFFRFQVAAGPEPGALWLQVTGGKGVKEVIEAELV
jgi:hypothetical protein